VADLQPRPNLSRIKPYQPGRPIEVVARELGIKDEIIKLASNENPLGISPLARKALAENIREGNFYPDDSGYLLKEKLAQRYGVDPEMVILGNGSVDLIYLSAFAYLDPGDQLIMTRGSFIIAKIATHIMNGELIEIPPTKEMRHDLKGILNAITDRTKVIYLDNPINPFGTIVGREEFDRFVDHLPPHVLLISDEAYYEYSTDKNYIDSMKHLMAGKNILILHTFSKIYGLAGLRIGYGIARKEIITALMKVRLPFNASRMAQIAAYHALDDEEHVRKSVKVNEAGKEYLYREYDRLGLFYLPTNANFIFVDFKIDAQPIFEKLQRRGVITRPIPQYGFPTALRITIGDEHQNRKLISALEEILGGASQ